MIPSLNPASVQIVAKSREENLKDITRFTLGLHDPTSDSIRNLNQIVDIVMIKSIEELREDLEREISPETKALCRRVIEGPLVKKLCDAYVEKVYPLFTQILINKDMIDPDFNLINNDLQAGITGQHLIRYPAKGSVPAKEYIIYDTTTHRKYHEGTADLLKSSELKNVQVAITQIGLIPIAQADMDEMKRIILGNNEVGQS